VSAVSCLLPAPSAFMIQISDSHRFCDVNDPAIRRPVQTGGAIVREKLNGEAAGSFTAVVQICVDCSSCTVTIVRLSAVKRD